MKHFVVVLLVVIVAAATARHHHHIHGHHVHHFGGHHHHPHHHHSHHGREIVIEGRRHHHHGEIIVDIPRHHHHRHHHGREIIIERPEYDYDRSIEESDEEIIVDRPRHLDDVEVDIDLPRRAYEDKKIVIDVERRREPCSRKADVFVHKLKPIVVHEKAQHYNVNAGRPTIVKTPPVVIHRQGHVKHEEHVVRHRPAPLFLTEEITKVSRPVHKKVYVEKFIRKEHPCSDEVVQRRLIKSHGPSCGCNRCRFQDRDEFVERVDLDGDSIEGRIGGDSVVREVDIDNVEDDVEVEVAESNQKSVQVEAEGSK